MARLHPQRQQSTSCTTQFATCVRGISKQHFALTLQRDCGGGGRCGCGRWAVCLRSCSTESSCATDVVVTLSHIHARNSHFRTGQSGKSTIVKQMKIIHGGGYTDREREAYRDIVHENIITAMQVCSSVVKSDRLGPGSLCGA